MTKSDRKAEENSGGSAAREPQEKGKLPGHPDAPQPGDGKASALKRPRGVAEKPHFDSGKEEQPEKVAENNPPAPAEEADDRFDFGGLPNRNLKKNLGCG